MKYRVSERVLRPLAANPHVVAQTELQLDARVELGGGEGGHAGEHGGPQGGNSIEHILAMSFGLKNHLA